MSTLLKLLVIATVTFVLGTSLSTRKSSGSEKKPYLRTGHEVTLSGKVSFTGDPPMARTIDTSSDPDCVETIPKMKTEDIITQDGALANVLMFVVSSQLDDYTFEPMTSPATLEHKGCRYVPRVMAIQVGQLLRIFNVDGTQHNTHPSPKVNAQWNQSQGIGSPAIEKIFDRPEVAIKFRDNMHPWEKAYVSVFSHPFFAISDSSGNYKIEGLPPGTYEVFAWHETLGSKIEKVVLNPGDYRLIDFDFSEADLQPSNK
jgi:hypothetical protein